MPDHTGRRRRQTPLQSLRHSNLPIGRFVVLFVALAAITRLLTLAEPERRDVGVTGPAAPPPIVVPTWAGPAPVNSSGKLADGGTYVPRIYVTAQDSVGLSLTADGAFWRILLRSADRVVELRRVSATDLPQFDGFTVSGDTLVWAESLSRTNGVGTTVWRTNWRTGAKATLVTSNTGEANFFGREYDLVVESGRVSWVSVGINEQTEIRSVPVNGGQVTIQRLAGQYALSMFPWAVSLAGGRGTPVELVNLSTQQRIKVPTNAAEIATCDPRWCRMAVVGNNELIRIDLQKPDGSQRFRIAGNEATPTITDVAMLDRYVPLKTDPDPTTNDSDGGLSLYDMTTGKTELVANQVSDVQAHAGVLWWSSGLGDYLVWHAIDLRTAS